MNQEEFEKRMQEIDTQLIKKGIPVQARRLPALKLFCPNSSFSFSPLDKKYFGEFEGPNLFEKIGIGKTLDEAVQAVNCMLTICQFVSEQITNIHKNKESFIVQEYEEGLLKFYLGKFLSLGARAIQGQDITTDIDNVVRECTEHLAIVKSSTEIGNLKRLIEKLKLILSDRQYSQQHQEWSDTLHKVLKLLEVRLTQIEK